RGEVLGLGARTGRGRRHRPHAGDHRRCPRGAARRPRRGGHRRAGRAVKLALIGGGGSRTPVLYHGLVERQDALRVSELVLHDTDAAALARIGRVLDGIDGRGDRRVPHRATTDLDDALDGAAFVLSAIRVGGFEGRVLDETIPLQHGVIGQETVGPGGFALALRNVPALAALAAAMAVRCPRAWLVNLSNPAGMVTQALAPLLDG